MVLEIMPDGVIFGCSPPSRLGAHFVSPFRYVEGVEARHDRHPGTRYWIVTAAGKRAIRPSSSLARTSHSPAGVPAGTRTFPLIVASPDVTSVAINVLCPRTNETLVTGSRFLPLRVSSVSGPPAAMVLGSTEVKV